ncbi:hypothetical protein [Chitinophaga vietnamensis]|uniref:hypothetical protein n=1 Tax=Chitinophaga vietnamensis TaxID=2593957 RepID=UPI0011776255|nr:hypothetical protein [Chitinophaga vietnamensis]
MARLMILVFATMIWMNNNVYAQTKIEHNSEVERIYGKVFKVINPSPNFMKSCKSLYSTIKITVTNNKIDSLVFIDEIPKGLLKSTDTLKKVFSKMDWQKVLPARHLSDRFEVFIPFLFSFEMRGCDDRIDEKKIKYWFNKDVDESKATRYVELELLKVTMATVVN